jgi:hypothetical protein
MLNFPEAKSVDRLKEERNWCRLTNLYVEKYIG